VIALAELLGGRFVFATFSATAHYIERKKKKKKKEKKKKKKKRKKKLRLSVNPWCRM